MLQFFGDKLYLIYRTEKGKPESTCHAALIEGTLTPELVKVIENELQKRYGNETFDVILYKKEKLSVPDDLKLKHFVDAYETADGYDDYDFRGNRNGVLYEIESWIADLKEPAMIADPLDYSILVYDDVQHQTLGAIDSIKDLTNEEFDVLQKQFQKSYTGNYYPIFKATDSLPNDLESRVEFAALRKKLEDGRLSDGRLRPIREATHLADTIRDHRKSASPTKKTERTTPPPVAVSAGVSAKWGDPGSADPPTIFMAPSSESQVDVVIPQVVPVFEPMSRKEMVDTLIEANLKTEALKNTPSEMKKERDIVFSETYGLTATDIARLDGATDANVRNKSDTIQKRLDRSKK